MAGVSVSHVNSMTDHHSPYLRILLLAIAALLTAQTPHAWQESESAERCDNFKATEHKCQLSAGNEVPRGTIGRGR